MKRIKQITELEEYLNSGKELYILQMSAAHIINVVEKISKKCYTLSVKNSDYIFPITQDDLESMFILEVEDNIDDNLFEEISKDLKIKFFINIERAKNEQNNN